MHVLGCQIASKNKLTMSIWIVFTISKFKKNTRKHVEILKLPYSDKFLDLDTRGASFFSWYCVCCMQCTIWDERPLGTGRKLAKSWLKTLWVSLKVFSGFIRRRLPAIYRRLISVRPPATLPEKLNRISFVCTFIFNFYR